MTTKKKYEKRVRYDKLISERDFLTGDSPEERARNFPKAIEVVVDPKGRKIAQNKPSKVDDMTKKYLGNGQRHWGM